ncbi:hypothetical protein INT45_006112 [Circinella minor]|uniref:Chromo domain-containing protein n=1 Tax=Circinella minor TaxID=1195481 RepID=A0A8H7S7Y0_9FUNG|nr:hypothetical protein INT45_006112 [Circinella minor]
MFSNIKIRVYSALLKNPKNFKNITLILDGHDSTIDYSKPDISSQKRWSYKLKTSGLRTQVLCDINNMIIAVSDSELCGVSSDGELNDYNFFYPIRKEPNENLNKQEKHFNDVFGSFRSSIENQFCELGKKFNRFSNNKSTLKTDDYKYVNLQMKVAFLLKNIKIFTETFNIITQDHHKLWIENNFEFPSDNKLIDIIRNENDIYINNNNNTNEIEEVDFPEYRNINKKKRKKGKSARKININLIRDLNKNNNFYEIENIVQHKLNEDNDYVFSVKWKNYDESQNSWVNEKDFNEKDIIKII